jgi:hypothetical protein
VQEFKGPSDDPALRDLDVLLEVGLGIDRRLNEERTREKLPVLERAQVSFWYLANHLGRRFLAEAQELFGACEALGEGLWRCRVAGHAVFLVSRDNLPVEAETVPLHLVCHEPATVALRVARVVQEAGWWRRFGPFLFLIYPDLRQEIEHMAQQTLNPEGVDPQPFLKMFEPARLVHELIKAVGLAETVRLVGLKAIIETVGLKRAIEEVGLKQVIAEVGLEELLANLTPEQREQLKQRLQ